jgi:hypothetical protein
VFLAIPIAYRAHRREDRRDAVFDAAVDPGKDFFQISAFF